MPEEYLKQTELQETEDSKIVYKGNTVWLEPKANATETDYARIVFKMKKIKDGYIPAKISFYDSTLNLRKSEFEPAIQIYKYRYRSGKCVKTKFLDNQKLLFEPEYLEYAIEKRKYDNDSSWISKYYNKQNKPRCGDKGYIIFTRIEPVQINWGDSISMGSNFVYVYKINCKGDTIK